MGGFIVIRPRDDTAARQASSWCDELCKRFIASGHTKVEDVDDSTPPDTASITAAIGGGGDLICYLGHGEEDAWTANSTAVIDATHMTAAAHKAVISIACKTGIRLGPDAITAGVACWLGFTVRVPVVVPHKTHDPLGDAIINGFACLRSGKTMQQARDHLYNELDQLVTEFDTGSFTNHPARWIGYFGSMSLRDHIVVHGNSSHAPLL